MSDDLLSGLPDQSDPLGDLPDQPAPVRPALLRANRYNPDQYAEATRTGRAVGVPDDVAARNPDQVKQLAQRQQIEKVRRENPALGNWLLSGENLTVSQDDLDSLQSVATNLHRSGQTTIADLVRGSKPPPGPPPSIGTRVLDTIEQFPSGFNEFFGSGLRGLGNLNDAVARTVDRGIRALPGGTSFSDTVLHAPIPKWSDPGTLMRGAGQLVMDKTVTNLPAERQNAATVVSRGLGQILGQGLTTAVAPGATVGLNLGMGADQAQQMVQDAGAEGTLGGDAAIIASAPVAAVLEKIGLDAVLERAPPAIKSAVTRYVVDKVIAAGVEGGEEAMEQVAYNAIAAIDYNPQQTLGDGVMDNGEAGAWVGGMARILVGGRYHRLQAESEGDTLDALSKDASASKLRERDPTRFHELVTSLANAGPDKVYLNAEKAMTYFQSANVDPATVGIDAEALSEAVALGGDITVPMADWLTHIAPEHGKALGEFARLTPAGMDRSDLATFDDTLDDAAARFLSSIEESQGKPTDTAVFNDVMGQLVGTGMDRSVAEKNAALVQSVFQSLATRTGMDAGDLYQRYGLRIVQEHPESLSILRKSPDVDATIDGLLDRLRSGDYPKDDRVSLADFVAEGGGVTDAKLTGEIKTLDESDRAVRKGKKRLVRADATRDLDRAREAAAEAGYLPMESDVNDFLAMLDDEMSGKPAYAPGNEDSEAARTRRAMDSLEEELHARGIDLNALANPEVRVQLFGGGGFDQAATDQTETPEFKAWFGESKVVDANGKPLVVYHGTRADFDVFSQQPGADFGFHFGTSEQSSNRLQGTRNTEHVAGRGVATPDGENVMPVYLSIQNPLRVTDVGYFNGAVDDFIDALREGGVPVRDGATSAEIVTALEAKGYDGLVYANLTGEGAGDSWIALHPTQIKSATANAGTFDPSNPSILHQSATPASRDTTVTAKTKGGEFKLSDTAAPAGTDFSEFGEVRQVQAFDGDKPIGKLTYANDGTPPTIEVDEAYRRRGVGTAMLKLARQQGGVLGDGATGIRGRAGEYRTEAGQAFRSNADEGAVTFDQSPVDQTETPAFKAWSGDAPLVTSADALTHEFKSGEKVVVEAYHGTKRPDRIGTEFKKSRATSGPMAYFTSEPEIASSYASGKNDTSLDYEDTDFANWFKVKVKGGRNPVSIDRAWWSFDSETRQRIAALAPRIRMDDDAEGIVLGDEGTTNGIGNYDWELKQARGNPLKALVESWLSSGSIYGEEQRFMDVLEKAGVPMDAVTYDSPHSEFPAVYKTFVAMRSPLVTNDVPPDVVAALNAAAKRDRSRAQAGGSDAWDKNTRTLREWVATFNEPNNEFVWTSIPDKVTAVFKALGYDGIVDVGGKGGGDRHRVYVPFAESQVKSATANRGTFDPTKKNILHQSDRMAEAVRRGYIKFTTDRQFTIGLTEHADLSTFLHESGHFFLEVMGDIASDENAPQAIRDDYAATLKWLGVDSREAITTDHHEQFARGFEAYLGEGKAPSPEMASAFSRFSRWIKAIYKTLTALNVNLTDEVRGVFDRLIAGDDAIQRAESVANMDPLFKEAAAAGVSEARFNEYLKLQQQGHIEAEKRMAERAMREVRREHEAWWREESASVQADVEAETHAMPVYQAWANLARGTQPDGSPLPEGVQAVKLDKQVLLDRYGQDFLNKNLLRKNVYAVEGGVHPDLVAVTYGFANGDDLVTALSNAKPMKAVIKAETQARMLERHGDMRMDPQLPEQAMAAIHNSKQLKAIEADVAMLESLTSTPAMNPAAVRAWATKKIASTRVRDLAPFQYLRSERRHAREALRAASAGNHLDALQASRKRLANAILYSEAQKAQDAVEKRSKWLAAQNKALTQKNLGKAGVRFRDSINDVLASLTLRQPTAGEIARKKPLRQTVDQMQAAGDEVSVAESVILRVDGNQTTALRDMTVAEHTEAYEAVKSLKHVAGQQNKLLATETRKTRDEAIDEMVTRAAEALPDRLPETLSPRDRTTLQQGVDKVARLFDEMDRPENVIEALDGGESGPWHQFYWDAMQKAENEGVALRRELATQLKGLRKAMPSKFMDSLHDEVELPFGARVSRATLVGIVLNTGNATNLRRLQNGGIHYREQPLTLTDDQVQAMRDLLTADEARYVQGLWDTVNSLWPRIVKLQTEMTGIPPEKVEAQAFAAGGATMQGGYWPLVYDHSKSDVGERQSDDDAMRLLMGQGYTRAVTPKGYTKSRVENVEAPLQLDFGTVMSRHLDHVMTDLAYRKAVKDITSIMRDTRVKDAINGRLGKTAYDTLKGALAYSVSPSDASAQAASMWRTFQGKIISNAAVSALAIRPDIALGNYASALVQAADRTGIKALTRGMWEFNTRRRATTEKIAQLSPFMAARLADIDHHYSQEIAKVQGKTGYGPAYKRVMMTLHRLADHDVTRAAWWGRYLGAMDEGSSSIEAARLADVMVRQTQTAAGRKDLSTLERDPAFRESRMFMGPMFVIMGRMRAAAKGQGVTTTIGSRTASLMLQVFVAPTIFMLAAGRWPTDDDDDDRIGAGEWAWWLARNTLLFPLQAMPIVREAGAAIEAALSDKPISPRAAPTAQAAAGLVKASKAIYDDFEKYHDTGEMDWTDMTRDLAVGAGPLTGLPSSQIRITSKTIEAIQDDPDRSADEFARMAIYGPPKK